jgi:hypothetical protein
MKAKTLLVAALMFFAFTAAAYSQAFFEVGSTPVTAVIKTGYAEKTGDITFNTVSGSPLTLAGTITVAYGVHVTNLAGANGIQIIQTSGGFVANPPTILAVLNGAGQVVINVPAGGNGRFTLTGVRIAAYPNYTSGNLVAQLSASQNSNSFVAGQNQAVVITNVADGLAVSTTSGVINYTNGTITTAPVVKIKEGFLDAFGRTAVSDITQTTGLMVRLTLSGALPTGYTLTFPASGSTDATTPAVFSNVTAVVTENSDGTTKTVGTTAAAVTVDATHLKIYYLLTSDSDPTKQETLTINPTLVYDTTKGLPPPTVSLSYTVTLAPIASADGVKSDGTLTADLLSPRFVDLELNGGTLFGVAAGTGTTNILVPWASYVVTSGYNTGIAIANTSLDPGAKVLFGSAATTGQAIPQAGVITFYIYPQTTSTSVTSVTPYTYTTQAGSPGVGLNASGQVIPGSTYALLVSDLLVAAGYPSGADFNGYIIAVAGFPNAHCQYIVTDFKSFANGGQGMIIATGRSGVTAEALDH